MRVKAGEDRPRRELEGSRVLTQFGLTWLEIAVRRVAGVRKDGEVRYRRLVTKYLVEVRVPGVVTLVTDREDPGRPGEPLQYEVTAFACSCEDFRLGRPNLGLCKHRLSVAKHNLLEGQDVAKV